jgi:hypothetical protein
MRRVATAVFIPVGFIKQFPSVGVLGGYLISRTIRSPA